MKDVFELEGRVEAVLIADQEGMLVSSEVSKIEVVLGLGVQGDVHSGTRVADVREVELLRFGISKGTEIVNHREFSAISVEELQEVARTMDLPKFIPYGSLCENLVVKDIPSFTELPSGTLLFFRSSTSQFRTAMLAVWRENGPCVQPGEAIQAHFPGIVGIAKRFPKAALGKRGVVGSVYCSGTIHAGDTIIASIPKQRIYDPQT